MEHKKDEPMIYLKDLLFAALYRWRAILIIAVAAALLLGCVKAISSLKNADPELSQVSMAQYQQNVDILESRISLLKKSIDNQQNYLDHSVFMQLDPYAFYEASLQLYVDTGYQINPHTSYQDADKTTAVLSAYASAFSADDIVQQLAKAIDSQSSYVSELYKISETVSSNSITFTIRCVTKDQANVLLALLVSHVDSMYTKISETVTAHSVSILEQGISQTVDLSISSQQTEALDRLVKLQTSLKNAKTELDALVPPAEAGTNGISVKSVVVFSLLGGILGVIVSTCVVWFMHITSNKVYAARNLQDRTGIKVIECVNCCNRNSVIDRWLLALEGRCLSTIDTHASLLAASIRVRCSGSVRILITGSAADDNITALVQALQALMPDMQITNAGNLLVNVEAISALAECDAVVLVEQCAISRYSLVSKELELISDCDKALIGCVLING